MQSEFLFLIVLILLSGFFSAAETALFSISRVKSRHFSKKGGKAYKLIHHMKEDPHKLLSTILIGNNLVNIAASALATAIAIQLAADHAVGIAIGIMTAVILIFGEIFPKSIATQNNLAIAKAVIFPLYWLSILFTPLIFVLKFIPKITTRMKKVGKVTEEELMTFVEVVEEEGEIKEEERELIHNIFQFDDTHTSEIMKPRADMFVIDADEELDLATILKSGFTRIPVIEGDIDHIVGILNIKSLFMEKIKTDGQVDIRKIMKPPYFVPEIKKLDSLLKQFQKRKQHMAIVVDEYGGVSGLVTLEDALEEIVGEIVDETDRDEPQIIRVKPNEWIVPGNSDIDEVNEKIPMNIDESMDYDTFSGFILNNIERIPKESEEILIGKFLVTVKEMDGNRIKKYVVKQQSKLNAPSNQEQESLP